ncbi:metallopeptidase TldD-related protein [Bengtsoniella intestinalis]|uniref:metallopeptidase TldD-related protein n=1 Tax=Bengtsoniella intestinalis TaxID=3073143 RepID=UPI00391F0533
MCELIYSQTSFYTQNYKHTTNNLEFFPAEHSDYEHFLSEFVDHKLESILECYNLICYKKDLELLLNHALNHNLILNFYCDAKIVLRHLSENKTQEQLLITFRAILLDLNQQSTIAKNFHLDRDSNFVIEIMRFIEEFVEKKMYGNSELEYCKDNQFLIFSPQAAAYFVHEIFGHMLEYDYVKSQNSIYSEKQVGTKLFHDDITVIDDPHQGFRIGLYFGEYQHNGKKLVPQMLIKDGVLLDFVKASRVDKIQNAPSNRMHILYLDKNHSGKNLNTLIQETKEGYVITTIDNAFIHPTTGAFHLQCRNCYKIHNGKKTGIIPAIVLQGHSGDILSNTLHVGSDLEFFASQCGKNGQILSVGTGAPSLLLNSSLFSISI